MSMMKIEHLRKEYPDVTPLEDVNAEINKGDIISIIGPSGTGKSTFLRCLNLLEKPTSGSITMNGKVITDPKCIMEKIRQKMGMVFQSFNLFDDLTVIENITAAPIDLLKAPKKQAYEEGMALLRRVGLAEKADVFPDQLSGGQKQRIAIARAIAMKPEMILFDEPTSALDPTMVGEVLQVIRNLAKEGMTMIIVTHEMKFARDVSTRVFYMDEGGIYEEGTPREIFDNPKREKTRMFIKRLKQLNMTIANEKSDLISISSKLELFGRENLLPDRTIRNILLIFEETVIQELAKRSEVFPIDIVTEISAVDNIVAIEISYSGESYDPVSEGNELSAAIVRKVSESIDHTYLNGRNKLRICLAVS